MLSLCRVSRWAIARMIRVWCTLTKQELRQPIFIHLLRKEVFMAYKVRRAKRMIGFGENKKERYVIVPDRGPVVTNKQICAKVVQRISTTEKMVSAILDAVVEQMIDHFRMATLCSWKG